jgi:aspartate carbamoyltransferase catalytic subunit
MLSFVGAWKGKDFPGTDDFSQEEIKRVLGAADTPRKAFRSRKKHHYLSGQTLSILL